MTKLVMPHDLAQLRAQLRGALIPPWDNAAKIRARVAQLTDADKKVLAAAITEYIEAEPAVGWQDFILSAAAYDVAFRKFGTAQIRQHQCSIATAMLRFAFDNLPDELAVSDDEYTALVKNLNEAKQAILTPITNRDVLAAIAKLRGYHGPLDNIIERDTLAAIKRDIQDLVRRHERSRILLAVEAIILGVIANGIFRLLEASIASLSGRAANTETQLAEVQSDLVRHMNRWNLATLSVTDFDAFEKEFLLVYVLHALAVLAVLGDNIRPNPLVSETRDA